MGTSADFQILSIDIIKLHLGLLIWLLINSGLLKNYLAKCYWIHILVMAFLEVVSL